MDHDQILEMVKRVRKAYAEELKGKQHKIDMNKNGKLDAQDFEHLRKMKKEDVDLEENEVNETYYKNPDGSIRVVDHKTPRKTGAGSHQAGTTMKHINKPTAGEKKAAKDIKPGIAGYRDRIAMLKSAEARGALKKEEVESVDEAKAPSGSPFSKDYKSQMPDEQKTSTKTYHDVKKISTGTVYTKQSDPEGHSKGTGDDAAKKAEPPVKRGRGRPVGSKSGARQAGSASKTDYRGFVTHTLNLPASK